MASPSKPAPLITPSDGGHLMTQSSADTAGLSNYIEKVNFRREGDVEMRREGWSLFPAQIFNDFVERTITGLDLAFGLSIPAATSELGVSGGDETALGLGISDAEYRIPGPLGEFFTNDYGTMSGTLVSATPFQVLIEGQDAFVAGADGAAAGSQTISAGGPVSVLHNLVVIPGQDAFVAGADGAPAGNQTISAGGAVSVSHNLVIVAAAGAFEPGEQTVSAGGLTSLAHNLVIVEGPDQNVNGVEGSSVGAQNISVGGLVSVVYAPA